MATNQYGIVQKRWFTAFLLSLFLGGIGADRFYLGRAGTAILKLITLGGVGVWALIDFIMIATKSMRGVEWVNDKKNDKRNAWVIFAVFVVLFLIISVSAPSPKEKNVKTPTATLPTQTSTEATKAKTAETVIQRQVQGKAVTIGAGTFSGGKDVESGLYDVTPGSGQTGNFIVNDGAAYNDVLGSYGVSKVRARISNGDKITISGLSIVIFTPVNTKFVSTHSGLDLYSGSFIVGEDVGAGRYTVTPGSGQTGNFIVNDGAAYNEVLGNYGVANVTVDLNKGDKITISGLNKVSFTPIN